MRIQLEDDQNGLYSFASDLKYDEALLALQRYCTKEGIALNSDPHPIQEPPTLEYDGPGRKVYRVIDDAIPVLTTLDELKALRKLRDIFESNEKTNTFAWIEEDELA